MKKTARWVLSLLAAAGLITAATTTSSGSEKIKDWPNSNKAQTPTPVPMGGGGGGDGGGYPPNGG